MPSITVQVAGGSRLQLDLPADNMQMADLRRRVAERTGLPLSQLRLISQGCTLTEEGTVQLKAGGTLLALKARVSVPQHPLADTGSMALDDSDREDNKAATRFKLPRGAPQWQRRLASFLQRDCQAPDVVLSLLFSARLWNWLGIIAMWCSLAKAAHRLGLGPLYVLATLLAIMLCNLGRRKPGQASAYSIFNEGVRQLPGTLNADFIDEQMRRGQM